MNWPITHGESPTSIVATTVSVAVAMTETLLLISLTT